MAAMTRLWWLKSVIAFQYFVVYICVQVRNAASYNTNTNTNTNATADLMLIPRIIPINSRLTSFLLQPHIY